MSQISSESNEVARTRAVHDRTRPRSGDDTQVAGRSALWWVISAAEVLTLASSWLAFWLTVEVVSADTGFSEQNPLANALLSWSTMALALSVLGTLVIAMGILRLTGAHANSRRSALVLSVGSGAVAAVSTVDVLWNLLLLDRFGGFAAVGTPGPAAILLAAGAVVYLGAVHWLSHRRWTGRATDADWIAQD